VGGCDWRWCFFSYHSSLTQITFFIKNKEGSVPKLKTNRGAAKRFKKTGTGKIKAKRAFARHILTKKSANRKRGLRTSKFINQSDSKGIKRLIPYI
jgi:large subunit ribosomal protein L35